MQKWLGNASHVVKMTRFLTAHSSKFLKLIVGQIAKNGLFYCWTAKCKHIRNIRGVASFTQIRTCVLEKFVNFLLKVKGICGVVTWPCILLFFIYWNVLCKMTPENSSRFPQFVCMYTFKIQLTLRLWFVSLLTKALPILLMQVISDLHRS